MTDSNLSNEQPSRPCTNQNSIHLPQCNADVLSDKREPVGARLRLQNFCLVDVGIGLQENSKNVTQTNRYYQIFSLNPLIKFLFLRDTEHIFVRIIESLMQHAVHLL